ncbi:MAG: hypothetical protein N4A45_10335 [Flavobacteriales bacterium]|jgi:hypothetical protein|nr:hypothetical protein [Flavobacteriales bacterium]
MAKEIEIAKLDIDTKSMNAKLLELQKSKIDLSTQIKDLKKATNNLTTATDEELKAYTELDKELKNISTEYNTQRKAVTLVEQANKLAITSANNEIKSRRQLRSELKILRTQRDEITASDERSIALRKKLSETIDEHTEALKDSGSEEDKRIAGIGQYEDAITSALNKMGPFGQTISNTYQQINVFTQELSTKKTALLESTKATVGASRGLKLFRIALISTGIGAIVVAIGLLVQGFLSTQRGMDAVTRVTKPLSVFMQKLWGIVQNLGTELIDSFENPQKAIKDLGQLIIDNILNRFKAVGVAGKAITKILSGKVTEGFKELADASIQMATGVTNATDKLIEGGKAVKKLAEESIKEGNKEVDLRIAIEQAEIRLVKKKSELNKLAREQKKISEDTTKSTSERISAAEKATDFAKQLVNEEQKVVDLKIREAELQATYNDTDRETQKQIAQLYAEKNEIEARGIEFSTTLQNQKNTITKQGIQASIKNAEAELDIYILNNKEKLKSDKKLSKDLINTRIAIYRNVANMQKAIEDDRLAGNEISKKEHEKRLLEIEQEFLDKKNNLKTQFDQQNLANEQKENGRKRQLKEFEHEQKLLDAESDYERRQIELDREREQKIAHAEKLGQDTTNIKEHYAELEKQINRDKVQAELIATTQLMGQLSSLLGRETKIGKTLAIAQATINTYVGATKALAQGGLAGALQMAGVITAGFAQVSKIVSTKVDAPKFYKGGQVGRTSTGIINNPQNVPTQKGGDNVLIYAKRGEMVLNADQQRRASLLYGNNVFGAIGVPGFYNGGLVGNTSYTHIINQTRTPRIAHFDPRVMTEAVKEGLRETVLVTPVDTITDIQTTTNQTEADAEL